MCPKNKGVAQNLSHAASPSSVLQTHRVHSSDRASKEDRGILEDLFVDEIREFNEEHNLDSWE